MRIFERILLICIMHYLSKECLTQSPLPGRKRLSTDKIKRLNDIHKKLCAVVSCKNRTNNDIKPRNPLNRIMAERSELSMDPSCMKFQIQPAIIHVAELHVHIKTKQKKKRRQKRITIIVEKLAADKTKSIIIRKRFTPTPNTTRYYKLNLPSGNGLQQPQQLQQQSLHLCLYCPRCKRQAIITLPTKRKRRKNKKNKRSKKKIKSASKKQKKKRKNKKSRRTLREKRPYIILKNFNLPSRKRSRRHLSLCSSRDRSECCVERKYVAFKDIGLHGYITHPKGFYKTQCADKCKKDSAYKDLNNSSMQNQYLCTPSYYKDLKLLVTVGTSVQKLTVPNGDIAQCWCERQTL